MIVSQLRKLVTQGFTCFENKNYTIKISLTTLKQKGFLRNQRGFRTLKRGFVENKDSLKTFFRLKATFRGFRDL